MEDIFSTLSNLYKQYNIAIKIKVEYIMKLMKYKDLYTENKEFLIFIKKIIDQAIKLSYLI